MKLDGQMTDEQNELLFLFPLHKAVQVIEKKAIREALTLTRGNKRKAATLLQIDYKTLLKKAKEYDLYNFGLMQSD